jgi:alpha/beta superfamily hydrolase
MREVITGFPSGALTLEGVLRIPEGRGPFPAVIICHPHPLYGGSMENNVVNYLCNVLAEESLIAFKFNVRGVGRSQGVYNQGVGEQEDVENATSFITSLSEVDSDRIGLVGYSAGAAFALAVGCNDDRIKALAAISPPLSMFDFEFLKECPKPKFLICGSEDDFTPAVRVIEFYQNLTEPKEHDCIEGADHFWRGYESVLARRTAAFLTKTMKL